VRHDQFVWVLFATQWSKGGVGKIERIVVSVMQAGGCYQGDPHLAQGLCSRRPNRRAQGRHIFGH
jgi:hypothetical protein